MRNKWVIALILIANFNIPLLAKDFDSDSRSRHHILNFSLYYPVSINQSKHDSTNINLSLFYGHVGQVHGIDLSTFVSAVEDEVIGVQLTGICGIAGSYLTGAQISGIFNITGNEVLGGQLGGLMNICGEDFHGIQVSGLFNITGDRFYGIQSTGFMNIVGERFQGLQVSGFFNITGNSFRGLQATGGFNITGDDYVGIQATGLFNVTGDTFTGVQVAGGFNIIGDEFLGLQLGTCNVAAFCSGAQIGVINAAGEMNGLQLGLINYSQETRGVPVGLINISKYDGWIRWISWASNISGINSGVKFSVNNIYSIVTIGGVNLYKDITQSLSYAGFYGLSTPFGNLSFDTDIGYMYLDNKNIFRSKKGEIDQRVIMLRASLNIELSYNLSLFGGSGLSYIKDRNASSGASEIKPIFFIGLELF